MLQRCYSLPQTERVGGWRGKGQRRGAGGGCAGRVVKDEGVRERQHLDPELFSQPSYICLV